MCTTCGCAGTTHDHDHHHEHDHAHDHGHEHPHGHEHSHAAAPDRIMQIERAILAKNDLLAERNRGWFAAKKLLTLNFMSSPGAGKTTLLERLIREAKTPISVIEGDQATSNDADRIRGAGARAVQINTGTGCHLDAGMIMRALPALDPPDGSIAIIENVGNLVCPALFDLGERAKVVVVSVTEGDDKPLKYPHMFKASQMMIVNKIDLLPHVQFDIERCIANARLVNPRIRVLQVSATRGDGFAALHAWLEDEVGLARSGERMEVAR